MLKTPDQSPAEPVHERLRRPMGRARWRAAVLALALGVCAIAAATGALTYRYLVEDAAQRGMAALNFHAEAFQGALDKYRILPALMAQRTLVRGIITAAGLAEPTPAPAQSLSGDLLGAHAALTGAAAIAVSDIGGRIVASSVDDLPQLGVGANISARSHFTVAIEGRLGRETVVTHGGRRLYIFSSAVRDRDTVIGAVSVAVDLEKLEQPWALTRDMIVAFERDGVIVLSNRESLRLRRLSDGADGASDTPSRTGLGLVRDHPAGVVEIDDGDVSGTFVLTRRDVAPLDWTMVDLADAAPIQRRAFAAGGLAGLAALTFALVFVFFLQRRQALYQKLRNDRATALRLERLVRDRTRDLEQTRTELLQASKLAALGQMSASIAHEFNQPLAAILSNADNAATLIERGQPDKAMQSIARVRGLVERLGGISRALKTFARKPRIRLQPVSLRAAVDAALMVLQPRRRESGVDVRLVSGKRDALVLAGVVRMEQVAVNLIGNAIDAALLNHPHGGGVVEVEIGADAEHGILAVRDNGAGVALSPKEAVFDPFVTTKEGGGGLGLGLSITFNIVKDFSGTIEASNLPGGGAQFTVAIPLAQAGEPAVQGGARR